MSLRVRLGLVTLLCVCGARSPPAQAANAVPRENVKIERIVSDLNGSGRRNWAVALVETSLGPKVLKLFKRNSETSFVEVRRQASIHAELAAMSIAPRPLRLFTGKEAKRLLRDHPLLAELGPDDHPSAALLMDYIPDAWEPKNERTPPAHLRMTRDQLNQQIDRIDERLHAVGIESWDEQHLVDRNGKVWLFDIERYERTQSKARTRATPPRSAGSNSE